MSQNQASQKGVFGGNPMNEQAKIVKPGTSNILRPVFFLALIFLSHLSVQSAERERTGTLAYPLKHNMTLKVGTLECWVKLGFEPSEFLPIKADYQHFLQLFSVSGEKGSVNVQYMAGTPQGRSDLRWDVRPGPKPLMRRFGKTQKVLWKKGEWHHIAFVWKEKEMWLYLDGQLDDHIVQQDSLLNAFNNLGEKPLLLGDPQGVAGQMVIDDFRLSKIDRKPEELGFAVGELKPDPYTGILDPLEGNSPKGNFVPDGKIFIQPLVILFGEGGLPSKGCALVQGKFGKGLSLYGEETKK